MVMNMKLSTVVFTASFGALLCINGMYAHLISSSDILENINDSKSVMKVIIFKDVTVKSTIFAKAREWGMCQRITMRNAWTYLSAVMVLYCTNNYICYDIKRKGERG